jgi:hypothetical protein
MASITYWNRLEPRPRATTLTRALTAQVRDPLWMLTRQWQFGEFQGEDAASPALVTSNAETAPMLAWRTGTAAPTPFDRLTMPLEPLVEREPLTKELSLRVELGETFRTLLTDAGLVAQLPAYLAQYRIPRPTEAVLAAMPDQDEARFLRVVAERSLDGVELYEDIVAAAPAQPATPAVPAGVLPVLVAFRAWVDATIGPLGVLDPPAWKPERLEYGVDVIATVPGRGNATLAAHPARSASFDWYSFDLGGAAPTGSPSPAPVVAKTTSILPMQVRFKGMPNKRWWHFEQGGTNFGAIHADKRDLGKLIVMDFMLVHGNDWFVIPFEMETGTICRVTSLTVRDVFGGTTEVHRADADAAAGTERWSMYSTSRTASPDLADFFILPPSAGEISLSGDPREEVWFVRDESDLNIALYELDSSHGFADEVLVQDLITGTTEKAQSVFCRGELIGFHAYRQVAAGVGGGEAIKESVDRPATRGFIERIGRHLGWHGALSVDYIMPLDSATPLLIDFPKDGRTVKGLVHPGRNGYLWTLTNSIPSDSLDSGIVGTGVRTRYTTGATMQFTYRAAQTRYRYISTGSPSGPRYTGLAIDPPAPILDQVHIVLSDGFVYGRERIDDFGLAPVARDRVVSFSSQHVIGSPFFECEDVVRRQLEDVTI